MLVLFGLSSIDGSVPIQDFVSLKVTKPETVAVSAMSPGLLLQPYVGYQAVSARILSLRLKQLFSCFSVQKIDP